MIPPRLGKNSKITIRGDSAAAWCCAHLLTNAGFKPALHRTGRPRLPAIMLSEAALALMRDVFERPDLFRTAPRITRRVVQWGRNAQPVAFDHAAVVVSERELLGELRAGNPNCPLNQAPDEGDFTIFASHPLPAEHGRTLLRFANRLGCAGPPEGRARLDILLDRITRRRVAISDSECAWSRGGFSRWAVPWKRFRSAAA